MCLSQARLLKYVVVFKVYFLCNDSQYNKQCSTCESVVKVTSTFYATCLFNILYSYAVMQFGVLLITLYAVDSLNVRQLICCQMNL